MKDLIRDFQQKVAEILKQTYFNEKDCYQITTDEIHKNNDVIFYAIRIREGNENICPTFYIDDYVKRCTPEEAAKSIYDSFRREKNNRQDEISNTIQKFYSFDYAKDYVCYRMINHERNENSMHDYPTMMVNDDLMLAFYCQVSNDASFLITNSMAQAWGIKDSIADTLFSYAKDNTERIHPASLRSLSSVIFGIEAEQEFDLDGMLPIFVLSNKDSIYGASTLLYQNGKLLDDYYHQIKEDYPTANGLFILPSSVHELLLIPAMDDFEMSQEELKAMVMSVNATEVQPNEFLSDNVFFYESGEPIRQITFSSRTENLER